MPEFQPAVDFTQIHFPSDQLTIAELRKLWPESFDLLAESAPESIRDIERRRDLEDSLGAAIDTEREYADTVFRKMLGLATKFGEQPDPEPIAEGLVADYISFRWAAGEHEAREMVRGLQSQALAQAQRFLGQGR